MMAKVKIPILLFAVLILTPFVRAQERVNEPQSGIIPKSGDQKLENGIMIWATRIGRLQGTEYLDIQTLANETGGELLQDKPENLNTTFQTLMDHLRSRYNLAFVSSNKKRDGTTRKLKIDMAPPVQKSQGKLVVKARRTYVAPRR
jgi:hypothetical protein